MESRIKLIEMTCPHCGAALKINPGSKAAACEYCNTLILIDDGVQHIQYDNAEEAGYQFERGRQRAKKEKLSGKAPAKIQKDLPRSLYAGMSRRYEKEEKRHTWLKWVIIAAVSVVLLAVLFSGNGKDTYDPQIVISESETSEKESNISNESKTDEITVSPDTPRQNGSAESGTSQTETNETDTVDGRRNESLKGRGYSDVGISEPQYAGIIGYAVISPVQEWYIEINSYFPDESVWEVPTYEQDKQFWNKTDTVLPHKTEVLVIEQMLVQKDKRKYTGYLLVEDTANSARYFIDVNNFVTKPYWTYQDDMLNAAKCGDFAAEYNQKSDYWPVHSSGDKLEIPDGTTVLITGITGSSTKVNRHQTDIEAIVWAEWEYGYGGVKCYFNHEDLTILY